MNAYVGLGPEIPRDTWEYEWMASVVAQVAAYGDRPSHWNGELYEQGGPVAGRFHPDGSMTISRTHVLDAARPAFTPGPELTSEEESAAAGATGLAVFHARLSLSEFGDDRVPGATELGSLEDQALELALADRFTQRYGGRIAEKLTDRPLPMVALTPAFPAYTTATDQLLHPLGAATGLDPERLRDLVENTARTQRFAVIADRTLDHQLGGLVPESHRPQLREDLTAPLRRGLGGLAMTECSRLTHPGSKLSWGNTSALWTAAEFDANLHDIKDHYEHWSANHPGVPAPELPNGIRAGFLTREETIRNEWEEAGWPAQPPVPGYEQNVQPLERSGTPRDLEIADLQRFLGSYTGATRHSGHQGERPDNVRSLDSVRDRGRSVE